MWKDLQTLRANHPSTYEECIYLWKHYRQVWKGPLAAWKLGKTPLQGAYTII